MKKTTNLGLSLYESEDKFAITSQTDSLNANMELIDAAFGKGAASVIEEEVQYFYDGDIPDEQNYQNESQNYSNTHCRILFEFGCEF